MKLSRVPRLIVGVLATERITRLIVEDEITRPLREAITTQFPNSKLTYLVSCKACVSVWAALAVSSGLVPRRVTSALAFSSAMLILDRQDERVGAIVSAQARKSRG